MIKFIAVLLLLVLIPVAAIGYIYSQKEVLLTDKIKAHLKELTGTDTVLEGVVVEKPKGSQDWLVKIGKMTLRNPASYKGDLAVLENIQIVFEALPLLQGQWKIQTLSARLKKIYLQTNEQGVLNITELPAIQAVNTPRTSKTHFWAGSVELQYGKLYQGKTVHKLTHKRDVYPRVDHADVLIQGPVLSIINELNQGSLGLPRGKLQEQISKHVDVKK